MNLNIGGESIGKNPNGDDCLMWQMWTACWLRRDIL